MKFGIGIPNMGAKAQHVDMMRLARLAQELKFDSIWLGDHVFMPYHSEPLYPYHSSGRLGMQPTENIFEPLITLAFMGGAVDVPKLGISVLIIPYRNPVVTAKMVATLDVLSGGRVILGAGVGWMREEFEILGASYQDRGSVTDEYIQIYKELCTADEPYFQGKHYQVSNIGFFPKPLQKPYPPVWIGGYTRAALRRTALLGDGWQPSNIDPPTLADKLTVLRRLCDQMGRDFSTIELSTRVGNVGIGDVVRTDGGRIALLSGAPQQIIDGIRRYEEVGVSHMLLDIRGDTIDEMAPNLERFAEEVRAVCSHPCKPPSLRSPDRFAVFQYPLRKSLKLPIEPRCTAPHPLCGSSHAKVVCCTGLGDIL